ncbi:hypothetical protein GGR14_003362 [Butyricimonas faecihominis]|uniref:Uncharacterized protein n=1 Tax=Butyricimonas faecihominis TaxID=1472416 RepID=A0A7W6HYZ9_9BACT|nr:hypothetical protein [Butyricimonas faecihominis]
MPLFSDEWEGHRMTEKARKPANIHFIQRFGK